MSLKVGNVVLMRNISEFLYLPNGTTAERPADPDAVVGMIRYNTDSEVIELYSNGTWNSLPSFSVGGGVGPGTNAIYSWGSDNYGESFRTPGTTAISPVLTAESFNFRKIISSKEGNNTFFIKNDDTLWGIGENRYGELGLDDTAPRLSITQLGTDKWLDISCYGAHVAGIKTDGTLWAWGANDYGQLGDGSTTQSLVPKQVGSLNDWVGIACGADFTIGIRSGTTKLWATGRNNNGQLGIGTNDFKSVMSECANTVKMIRIFCGKSSAYAVSDVGGLYSWGSNTYGQLGRAISGSSSPTPTVISTFSSNTHSASISVGAEHVLVAHYNGYLYGFGRNDSYQLGTGNNTNQTSPYTISATGNWWFVSAGSNFSVGLRGVDTGNLWVWGDNASGQLGTGDQLTRTTPHNIAGSLSWNFLTAGLDNSIGTTYNPTVDYGGQTFTSNPPVGYTDWEVPSGVTSICIAAIGGGGGGGRANYGSGAGGGGVAYANNIKVTPGERLRITVGLGGNGGTATNTVGSNGGNSSVSKSISGILTTIVEAYGGSGGTISTTGTFGAGGSYFLHSSVLNGGGFTGGNGDPPLDSKGSTQGGGSIYIGAGGGGGGFGSGTILYGDGAAGGGVSPTSGGVRNSSTSGGGGGGGQLGAGLRGTNGSDGATSTSVGSFGGNLGGGGGGAVGSLGAFASVCKGGNGAVRIIWGYGRAFPSFLTEKLGSEP